MGRRAKRAKSKVSRMTRRNERWGIFTIEREMREDRVTSGKITTKFPDRVRHGGGKRGATAMRTMGSNKRYKPGD